MKNIRYKKLFLIWLIVSMATMYGFLPLAPRAQAVDSLLDVSDTISDSQLSTASTTHTIVFTTGTTTPSGGHFNVTFDADITNIALANGIVCGYSWQQAVLTASSTAGSNMVDCDVSGAGLVPTTTIIVVYGTTNPDDDGDRLIEVGNWYDDATLKERAETRVYYLEDTEMTARVGATLSFTVTGTTSSAYVGDVACQQNTTATSTDFGTLVSTASTTVCQQLQVGTNATDGYIVTVQQDQELTSSGGDNINSFINAPTGQGSSTAVYIWQSPTGVLDQDDTYGHMGLTSNDTDLSSLGGYLDFYNSGDNRYAGLNGIEPIAVMHHDGPTNDTIQDKGLATVAFTAEISALQQAGDYTNNIVYVATPTF